MRIYQLINTLIRGDGIGNDTFALHKILQRYDSDALIYAINIGPNVDDKYVKRLYNLDFVKSDDIVLYHMCESSIINGWLKKIHCVKIAIYHNSTPAMFFADVDFNAYIRQKEAEREISELKDVFDLCIADSEFNERDLVRLGYDKTKIVVMPIIIPTYEYTDDLDKVDPYYEDDLTNILFVGRIVPNKKQDDVIRAFAYYQRYYNKKSRLILVGSPFSGMYLRALIEYITDLGAKNIIFLSGLSFHDIKRVYKCADLFLCMSEHEGFCIPLVEAMLFKIPIVAYGSTAIPETMGGQGCIVDTKNPYIIASYIDEILRNKDIHEKILQCQAKAVRRYEYPKVVGYCERIIENVMEKFKN
jgi:glycosyltransferase involved in cell wall biosynthesis